jgi:hypothetical protein
VRLSFLSILIVVCLAASLVPAFAQSEPAHAGSQPGQLYLPQPPDDVLRDLLGKISQSNIQTTVQTLVSFGTRHTASSQTDPVRGIGAATNWVFQQLQTYAASSGGNMTVQRQTFTQPVASNIPVPTTITNVIATLNGSGPNSRTYVIVAHLDDRVTDVLDFTSDAPGADGDASGVAVVMELARVMATRVPSATILFSVVAGEEQGLYGSSFEAAQLAAAGIDVEGVFSVDTIGNIIAQDGTKDQSEVRLFTEGIPTSATANQISLLQTVGGEDDSSSRELGRFAKSVAANTATGMSIWLINRRDRILRGGDQISFSARGFPAARFTEPNEDFNHERVNVQVVNGVQFGDLASFLDFGFIAKVAKVNAAAIWSLAVGPGTPKNVQSHIAPPPGLGGTNATTLSWDQGTDPGLAGYEVVWRNMDDTDWTHVISVGNVTTVSFPFFPKDNFIMGVRAVDINGHHSPVAYPTLVN